MVVSLLVFLSKRHTRGSPHEKMDRPKGGSKRFPLFAQLAVRHAELADVLNNLRVKNVYFLGLTGLSHLLVWTTPEFNLSHLLGRDLRKMVTGLPDDNPPCGFEILMGPSRKFTPWP